MGQRCVHLFASFFYPLLLPQCQLGLRLFWYHLNPNYFICFYTQRHLAQDFPKPTMRLEPKSGNFWKAWFVTVSCTSHDSHSGWMKLICSMLLFSFDSRTLNPSKTLCFPHRNEDPAKCFVMVGDTDKKKPCKA